MMLHLTMTATSEHCQRSVLQGNHDDLNRLIPFRDFYAVKTFGNSGQILRYTKGLLNMRELC